MEIDAVSRSLLFAQDLDWEVRSNSLQLVHNDRVSASSNPQRPGTANGRAACPPTPFQPTETQPLVPTSTTNPTGRAVCRREGGSG